MSLSEARCGFNWVAAATKLIFAFGDFWDA